MNTYQLSPRVTLRPGDRIRVTSGPYYRLASGERVTMAARGVFTLLAVEQTSRGRVTLLGYGAGGYAVLHVAGRRRSRIPGLVARPYRVRRVGARKKTCGVDSVRDDS